MYLYIEKKHFRVSPSQLMLPLTEDIFFVYFGSMAAVLMVRPSIGLYTSKICYKQIKIKSLKQSSETYIVFAQFLFCY